MVNINKMFVIHGMHSNKKKTIQKYNKEINKNYKEQDWAEIAMLEEEI